MLSKDSKPVSQKSAPLLVRQKKYEESLKSLVSRLLSYSSVPARLSPHSIGTEPGSHCLLSARRTRKRHRDAFGDRSALDPAAPYFAAVSVKRSHNFDLVESSHLTLFLHILYSMKISEEDKERAKSDSPSKNKSRNFNNSDSDEDEEEDIPASLMLLFTAHEFLGRRSWCCINEAKLLLFAMNVTIPKLKSPQLAPVREKLGKYVEQVLYCLYAHPSKSNKTKAKYLEEHGVPQMKLTWEAAQQLYDFYKLDTLPAIDDYKVLSITSEMENLFKRITRLVPPESDPAVIADDMLAYIRKDRDKMPSVQKPLPYQISSIYYLLGDYYFKTSDWSHGIRYYLLDLCLHPVRFNSWAGLAMATGTQLEIRLNSCQTLKLVCV